ncbi:DNA-binding transcriptional regulator [Bacteroides sp. 51]|uniref:DNA-binding transcriptional regulator n=1 Tax=Bacteroides sp. 51 TaxID=2302938 RepID=UPI0013D3CBAF|nr:DNA-binding transcriptional regulator [Bacteroides sp. 51]NDV82042.1 helix-turn-helix domain-containing protein [Bacteroides sp. 51]
MARLILLTDFSEEYAKLLLKGIVQYSKEHTPWVLCKMPLSYRDVHGIEGVLEWALKWKADAIIGQFYPTDKINLFKENGIIAIAQDFKTRFKQIPNITGAHHLAGRMGASYFIQKGFKNFAFYGFKDIVWSEERCTGFKDELIVNNLGNKFFEYQNTTFKELWYYEPENLINWLKALPKPIGLMTCDDNQAHHITEICKQYEIKIPEEIAVLGVDNDDAICSLTNPPLSSINQAVEKGGYETAKLIDQLMQSPDMPYEDIIVLPTHVITRQSTDIYATNDKYIAIVLKHIHQNIDQKLNVNDISRLVPLSRRLLETKFKQVTGLPVYAYIFKLRIEKFAQTMLESSAPIVEIAMNLGLSDYKNISRQFKQVKGCTPSEYRLIHSLKR